MHEAKFRRQLAALQALPPPSERPVTRRARAIDFPAWRSIFSSLLLYGHARNYALPSVDAFVRACQHNYTHDCHQGRYDRFFADDELGREVRHRLIGWYEAGMAETYLYVCLVDAIEDVQRSGLVLYDSRVDWKLKADAVVLEARGAPSRFSFPSTSLTEKPCTAP